MAYTPKDFPGLIKDNIRLGRDVKRLREELAQAREELARTREEIALRRADEWPVHPEVRFADDPASNEPDGE